MALFGKKKRGLSKQADMELEDIRRQRRELHDRLGASDESQTTKDRAMEKDTLYQDIDEGVIRDLFRDDHSRKQGSQSQSHQAEQMSFKCMGCGNTFPNYWDSCPRCGGEVKKKENEPATGQSPPSRRSPREQGLDVDFLREQKREPDMLSPPAPSRRQNAYREERPPEGTRSHGNQPLNEDSIFSKEVRGGSLYNRGQSGNIPMQDLPPPAAQQGTTQHHTSSQTANQGSKFCSYCGKTSTRAPPGGWKFCVHCGKKL